MGAHTPPRKKPTRSAGSRWPAPKLPDLLLQLLDAPGPLGGGAGPVAGIDPGLAHPAAQGLGVDPQLVAHAPETPPGPVRVGQGVQHQPDRAVLELIRVRPGCRHDPSPFLGISTSTIPGIIHSRFWQDLAPSGRPARPLRWPAAARAGRMRPMARPLSSAPRSATEPTLLTRIDEGAAPIWKQVIAPVMAASTKGSAPGSSTCSDSPPRPSRSSWRTSFP